MLLNIVNIPIEYMFS